MMVKWRYAVRRVDLPAGGYEPHAARATFMDLEDAMQAADAYAAEAAGCYTPRIYQVRTREHRAVYEARVLRAAGATTNDR
jgi:hypothetical protein